MSSAHTQAGTATFFELYSRGQALPDEIDDFVERWHANADLQAQTLPLHGFLGLSLDEYELWVKDPDVLPLILSGRREKWPVQVK